MPILNPTLQYSYLVSNSYIERYHTNPYLEDSLEIQETFKFNFIKGSSGLNTRPINSKALASTAISTRV